MANDTANYVIEEKEVAAQQVVSIRHRASRDDLSTILPEVSGKVTQYIVAAGVPEAGPYFAHYHAMEGNTVDVEAGLIVAAPVAGAGEIGGGELSVGKAASTMHIGPYDTIWQAHMALEGWVNAQGKRMRGSREIYWTDPAENPDPSTWRTEIMWFYE